MQMRQIIEKNKQCFIQAYEWGKTKAPNNAFRKTFDKNQVFLNITGNCPLECSHCAVSAKSHSFDMSYDMLLSIINKIIHMKYRILSLNGGEPFMFKYFISLVKYLNKIHHPHTQLWLNTNLYCDMSDEIVFNILNTFDHIIISIDGGENEHDNRRGQGSFKKTFYNFKKIMVRQRKSHISIRATLTSEQIKRGVKNEVKNIAKELGIHSIYFSNLLPIGRAKNIIDIDKINQKTVDNDYFTKRFMPRNNCGIGKNLHITPTGDIYPCWAMIEDDHKIGNIKDGFNKTIKKYKNGNYFYNTVDNIEKCKLCDVRYICGGICYSFINSDCTNLYDLIIKYLELARDKN
jgi:uncharacterized protein